MESSTNNPMMKDKHQKQGKDLAQNQAAEQAKIIDELHQKKEKKKLIFAISAIFLLTVIMLSVTKVQATRKVAAVEKRGGIDSLLIKISQVKENTGLIEDFEIIGNSLDRGMQMAREAAKKDAIQSPMTDEQRLAKLQAPIGREDKQVWYKELDSIFEVGADKPFYLRQIKYAKTNLDLAVISGGIINTHKVLEGSHKGVKTRDEEEYLSFIRDQVQSAIASNDERYKAIVFKAIESTGY